MALKKLFVATVVVAGLTFGAWAQQVEEQHNSPQQGEEHQQTAAPEQPHGRSAGGDIGSGAGDIGKGAGAGVGHAAEGVGKGAGDLVTLHPLGAAENVGKGAGVGAKDVGVGAAKGTGKVMKGTGKAIKHVF